MALSRFYKSGEIGGSGSVPMNRHVNAKIRGLSASTPGSDTFMTMGTTEYKIARYKNLAVYYQDRLD